MRRSRLAIVSCGMVSQSAASRSPFPFGNAITTDAARVREITATIERPVTIRGREVTATIQTGVSIGERGNGERRPTTKVVALLVTAGVRRSATRNRSR